MTNILFLDLDGPAWPNRTISFLAENRQPYPGDPELAETLTYWKMDEIFKSIWTHCYNVFDFEVVISSTWRIYYDKPECFYDIFSTNNIPLKLHKDWRTPKIKSRMSDYNCYRAEEINEWLKAHPEVKNYVIIDDAGSGASLEKIQNYEATEADQVLNPRYLPLLHLKPHIILVDEDSGFSSSNCHNLIGDMKRWAS